MKILGFQYQLACFDLGKVQDIIDGDQQGAD